MKPIQKFQKALATLLTLSVWHLTAVGSNAAELGAEAPAPPAPVALTQLLAAQAPAHGLTGVLRALPGAQPKAAAASIGRVTWKSMDAGAPAWNCQTGPGSSALLDLKAFGKVGVLERSIVNIRSVDGELVLDLLAGSVALDAPAGTRARFETYDGVYVADGTAGAARLQWRDGGSVAAGMRKVDGAGPRLAASGLEIHSGAERFTLPAGRSGVVRAVVTGPGGAPLAGVPVSFAAARRGVAVGGSSAVTVLTDDRGVAETNAAATGEGPAGITATIAGTPAAAAVPADVGTTTGGQKAAAIVAIAVAAAVAIAFAVKSAREKDPKLVPGTPVLVP